MPHSQGSRLPKAGDFQEARGDAHARDTCVPAEGVAQPRVCFVPIDVGLLELARWGAVLVNAALTAHRKTGDEVAHRQLHDAAAALLLVLPRVSTDVKEISQSKRRRRRA